MLHDLYDKTYLSREWGDTGQLLQAADNFGKEVGSFGFFDEQSEQRSDHVLVRRQLQHLRYGQARNELVESIVHRHGHGRCS